MSSTGFRSASRSWRYSIAVVSVVVAMVVRLALDPLIGSRHLLFVSVLAVVTASRFGGSGPGLAASALSVVMVRYLLIEPRYSFANPNSTEVRSLVAFAIAAAGISFLIGRTARLSNRGMAGPNSRFFLRRTVLVGGAFLMLAALTFVLYADFERNRASQKSVTHTYQVLQSAQSLLSNLQDAESGQSGYLITGDKRYLEPFQAALRTERFERQRLRQLTSDNPAQQERLSQADGLVEARYSALGRAIALRSEKGFEAARASVLAEDGQRIMDDCRTLIREVQEVERVLLAKRTAASEALAARIRWVLGLGSGALLALLVIAGVVIERDSRSGERDREAVRRSRERLRLALDAARRAEQELRESEARLRLAQQVARIGTFERNLQTGVTTWTPELEAIHGLQPGEFAGSRLNWENLVHPEDRSEAVRQVKQAFETGKFEAEWRVIWPDGTLRWLAGRAWVVKDEAGKALRLIGVNIDITESRAAAAMARQWQRAFEQAELGISLSDSASGTLQTVNASFARERGYTVPELTGYPIVDLVPQSARAALLEFIRIADRDGHVTFDSEHLRKDGTCFPIRVDLTVIRNEAGAPAARVAFVQDLTRQKQAELEIRELNGELEKRVRERTAQLEGANKELEAFAYSVSHDLRAPLRGIDGWSLALAEDYAGELDERAHRYLGSVRSETQRMGVLIDDMLQLSCVTRTEIQFKSIDLTEAVLRIASGLAEAHPARRIEFVIEPGVTGSGDARLVEIALTNLLANAVKFTGPRALARIEFGRAVLKGEPAFFVRDNGVGFDMAYAASLFSGFRRLHKVSEFSGTGIGLATVQRVIHRHGGRVWAEARVDRGATFYFTIGETA